MGFIQFSQQLIRNSNDEQMLIQYMAYRSHSLAHSRKLYSNQKVKELILKFTKICTYEEFHQKYIIATQFRSSRTFGHTKEALLIPGLDYLNYDPSKGSSKIKFVSFNTLQEIESFYLESQIQQLQINNQMTEMKKYTAQFDQLSSDDDSGSQFDPVKNYVCITNVKPIYKGEQLLFDYGRLSNYHLFRYYGYTVENNPHDSVRLYLSKYYRQRNIYFSAVQRCTTKFKLRLGIVNLNLIAHWAKIMRVEKVNKQILLKLIQQLQKYKPPVISMKNKQFLAQQSGFRYLQVYQKQQQKIYNNQKALLIQYTSSY